MNTFIKLLLGIVSLLQGLLIIYYGVLLSYIPDYLLDTEQYDALAQYIRHPLIIAIFVCQFLLLIGYLLYLFRFWKLFHFGYRLYSDSKQLIVNISFLLSIVILKAVELIVRSTFYYGEVSDKHVDNEIYFLLYPIAFIFYSVVKHFLKKDKKGELNTA